MLLKSLNQSSCKKNIFIHVHKISHVFTQGNFFVKLYYEVFKYVIIKLYRDNLMSSDMQFAYKTQHSTALCSVVFAILQIER